MAKARDPEEAHSSQRQEERFCEQDTLAYRVPALFELWQQPCLVLFS